MTGFSRATAVKDEASIVWEMRSVNGKTLEIRLRLPPGCDRLEPSVRKAIQKRFSRGAIQATLSLGRAAGAGSQPIVNEAFLKDLAGLAKRLEDQFGIGAARADGLLALRGVLEVVDTVETEESRSALDLVIAATLDEALAGLETARAAEGQALARLIAGHVDAIEALVGRAQSDPSREPRAIRARLAQQVAALMDATAAVDADRLHMEAALLATRADIREEIDRLGAHIASARSLLAAGGPVGRKLDFLAQEFNRESNTLCSKSNAGSVTAIGLDMKAAVDQFREQVQNVE